MIWRKVEAFYFLFLGTWKIFSSELQKKDLFFCSVFGSPDCSCHLINGKVTLLTSIEQIQPLTLLGLCSGQEVVSSPGQILFSCLNLVKSSGTKSIAPIQSALKGRQLSKGTQVKAGDSRWNSVIIFQRTSRLWSLVMLLWPTSDLSPQIQFGAKLCLSSEYGVPFCSWTRKTSENIYVLVT